jgi:hypothetical protein
VAPTRKPGKSSKALKAFGELTLNPSSNPSATE